MSSAFEAVIPRGMLWLALGDAVLVSAVLACLMLLAAPSAAWFGHAAVPLLLSAAVLLCLHYYDLYDTRVTANTREVALRLTQALGTLSIGFGLVLWLHPAMQTQLGLVGGGLALAGVVVGANRRVFWMFHRSSGLAERVLLIGNGGLADAVATELRGRPELGMNLIGRLTPETAGSDLQDRVLATRAERVIVAMPPDADGLSLAALVELRSRGVRVSHAAQAFEHAAAKVALDGLDLPWLLALDRSESTPCRWLGRGVAAVALVLIAPLLGLIALAVRLDSPGPAIFRQPRIGRGGRTFWVYKFRSMWLDADRGGAAVPAMRRDPRITRVGRFIRRCRLDELPQLFNIARGDLAFVGPRPFVPEQERELTEALPFYCYRWTVAPGVTGWAQIHQGYCATLADNREKLAYDLFYIKHRSVVLDLFILALTVKVLLLGRGAR